MLELERSSLSGIAHSYIRIFLRINRTCGSCESNIIIMFSFRSLSPHEFKDIVIQSYLLVKYGLLKLSLVYKIIDQLKV